MMKVEKEDRISSLPDDVLAHILSFLELRDVFRTCLLSKRWEKVWTLNWNINLNLDVSKGDEFIDFISKVSTRNRISPVKSFSLSYYMGLAYYLFHKQVSNLMTWIDSVTTQNFEKFGFRIASGGLVVPIKMPATLFRCQKLVTLHLECTRKAVILLDVHKTVCFSSLKILRLAKVLLDDEKNSFTNLLSGCPVLEELCVELELSGYDFRENRKFFVISPSLKILRWKRPVDSEFFGSFYVVEAPKLEYLEFVEHSLLGISMSDSPSLISAVMHIRSALCHSSTISLMELFQGISNARRLEFSTLHSFMVKEELDRLPDFCNLIHLKIGSCKDNHFVDSILQHSPHLKHLIFDKDHFTYGPLAWTPLESVPTCLVSHLETIEIVAPVDLVHTDYVTEMILYLLHNGKVLKKMAITPLTCKGFLRKLWEYRKASIGCKIEFSNSRIL